MKAFYLITSFVYGSIFFVVPAIHAQDAAVKFYDVIKEDSVQMYFDNSYNFTEQSCGVNRRYIKIDTLGDFFQSFEDINSNNILIGKGYYNAGMKNGYFETFYSNGQVKTKGNYKDNNPSGIWYYFYEDGKPERQLLINMVDTLLMQFYDENGVQLVTDGNGRFNGLVGSNDRFLRTKIIATGMVVNGKPDGVWKSTLGKYPYCTEKFDKGVFVYGEYSSILEKNKKYTDRSYLKTILPASYIESLEQFHIVKCSTYKIDTNTVVSKRNINTSVDLNLFKSYVNDAIGRIIDIDIRNGNFRDYQPGENVLKISFTVNDKGIPTDFKRVTNWGDQYFDAVTNALSRHAKLPTSSKPLYYQLTIIKSESNTISYSYSFSTD